VAFSGSYSGMMGRGGAAGTSVRPGSAGPAPGTSFSEPYNFVSCEPSAAAAAAWLDAGFESGGSLESLGALPM